MELDQTQSYFRGFSGSSDISYCNKGEDKTDGSGTSEKGESESETGENGESESGSGESETDFKTG